MVLDVVLRSILAFGFMMIITRTLGKTTISQMTFHDFVASITLGSMTANLAFNVQINQSIFLFPYSHSAELPISSWSYP